MSLKGAVLALIALVLGGLLLFSRSGGGVLVGLSVITIASAAVVTALTRGRGGSGDRTVGRR